jgi:prepilin-type N-terminal cleavage/methylation domain-containing protein
VSGREDGFTMVELLTVMVIMGIVVGGIVTLFAAGINADADQNRRFQAQQDGRIALDKMRREIHAACTVSNPAVYNTAESSVTLYMSSDGCASGSNSVSWCTVGSGSRYGLYRIKATSCTGATQKFADYLTSGSIFIYLPPSSHIASTQTLGGGTGSITTADGGSTLPRLHVDLTVNRRPAKSTDGYRLTDDIAFRNGPRGCVSGPTC